MQHVADISPTHCRQSVEEKFSAGMMAKQYIERYKEVMAKSAKA